MKPRDRVEPLKGLKTLSDDEHKSLRQYGINDKKAWSPAKDHPLHSLVAKFKGEVKSYYYWGQGGRCCYCSSEIPNNATGYHGDHIVDKATFGQFTFEPGNFCAACPVCNVYKSMKNVLVAGKEAKLEKLPVGKDDYLIVHPHIDEWSDYLMFDSDGLIKSVKSTGKGKSTIDICGIEAINFTRLAVKFSVEARQDAYRLMCKLVMKRPKKDRQKDLLSLLGRLAANTPQAEAAVKGLSELLDA